MNLPTAAPPRFVLPGRWGRINLTSEATTIRSVRKVVEAATGRRDDLASTRAELRARFQKAAAIAREGGATDFYVAFQLTTTIQLPAWVSVFTPEVDSTDFAALGLDELRQFIDTGTKEWGGEAGDAATTTTVDSDRLHAVRHSWRRRVEVEEGEVTKDFTFVEADYWIAATNPNRIALLTFSTALAEHEESMLELFDAIVTTLRWPAVDTPGGMVDSMKGDPSPA